MQLPGHACLKLEKQYVSVSTKDSLCLPRDKYNDRMSLECSLLIGGRVGEQPPAGRQFSKMAYKFRVAIWCVLTSSRGSSEFSCRVYSVGVGSEG